MAGRARRRGTRGSVNPRTVPGKPPDFWSPDDLAELIVQVYAQPKEVRKEYVRLSCVKARTVTLTWATKSLRYLCSLLDAELHARAHADIPGQKTLEV